MAYYNDSNRLSPSALDAPTNEKRRVTQFDITDIDSSRYIIGIAGGVARLKKVIRESTFLHFNKSVREGVFISLMITIIKSEPTVYGLTDDYLSMITFLYNKYLIISSEFLPLSIERRKEVIQQRDKIIYNMRWEDGEFTN